jgi:hypothetical protein
LTLKIACDANDVVDEATLDGGRRMSTRPGMRAADLMRPIAHQRLASVR